MTGSETADAPSPRTSSRQSIGEAWGILVLLVVEAIIGVGVSLYVSLPSSPTYAQVFVSYPLLTAHIVVALLLLGATAHQVVRARRSGVVGLLWKTVLTFLFVLLAIQEGLSFSFTQNNMFVGGMVVGFLGALLVQIWVLVALRRHRTADASQGSPPTAAV